MSLLPCAVTVVTPVAARLDRDHHHTLTLSRRHQQCNRAENRWIAHLFRPDA